MWLYFNYAASSGPSAAFGQVFTQLVSLLTDFDHPLSLKLPSIVRKVLYTPTVGLGNTYGDKSRRFSGMLNSKS